MPGLGASAGIPESSLRWNPTPSHYLRYLLDVPVSSTLLWPRPALITRLTGRVFLKLAR